MKWIEQGIWEQVLVADDGEIVGSITKNMHTNRISTWPMQKQYIDRESAKKAVESFIAKQGQQP